MSLKISFESDLKGFERVQSALKEQEKILNSNADAVERLKKAQSGMAGEAVDMGKNHSMKEAAKQMETLTGAFDSLQKNQSGFRAFLNNFTDFKKELKDISAIKSGDVFGAIELNIDTLKKSLTGSVTAAKDLRAEVAQLKAEGKNAEASKAQSQLSAVEDQALQERRMLQDAQMKKMWRQPLLGGPPGGSGIGSVSLGGIAKFGAKALGVGTAVYQGAKAISKLHDQYGWGSERGVIAEYNQAMSIQGQAEQGNVARALMRKSAFGAESRYMDRRGDSIWGGGDSFVDNIGLGFKAVSKWAQGKKAGQIKVELENERSQYDEATQKAINFSATTSKRLVTSKGFAGSEATYGYQASEGLVRAANAGGVTWDQAQNTLGQAARYGGVDFQKRMLGSKFVLPSEETGYSQKAVSEGIRQSAYSKVDQADLFDRIAGSAGKSGLELSTQNRQQLSGIIAEKAGQFAGQVDMGQIAAPMLNTMQAMQGAGMDLQGGDMVAGAKEISSFAQGRAQQAGSMEGMALEKTLIDLGIKNASTRRQIIDLYTNNQGPKAVSIIAQITGKSKEEVNKALGASQTLANEFRKDVLGYSETDIKAFEDKGVDLVGQTLGGVGSAMAVPGGSDAVAAAGAGMGDEADLSESSPTGATTKRKIGKSEASKESSALDSISQVADLLKVEGGNTGEKLASIFTGYSEEMVKQVEVALAKATMLQILDGGDRDKLNMDTVKELVTKPKAFKGSKDQQKKENSE